MHLKLSPPFYLKLTCTLITLVIIGYLAILGQTVLVPLILGLLFAILLLPLCNFLQHRLRFPRSLAAISATVLFTAVIIGIFFLIGKELASVADDWPEFQTHFLESFSNLKLWIQDTFGVQEKDQLEYINQTTASTVSNGSALIGKTLLSLSSVLILLVFTFLFTLFILLYRRHLVQFLIINFKEEHHGTVLEVVNQIQYMVKKYLLGLVIQMGIVSTLTFIAFTLIGVKYTLMLALITGIFNVLPYIGILTSMVISVIITFGTASVSSVVFVVLSLIAIHIIDGNYVMPKIVGSKVKINSLFAILGLVIGEKIWGIAGMFLTIPIIAIIKIVFDRINELKTWGYLLGESDEEPPIFNKAMSNIFRKKQSSVSLDEMNTSEDEGDVKVE